MKGVMQQGFFWRGGGGLTLLWGFDCISRSLKIRSTSSEEKKNARRRSILFFTSRCLAFSVAPFISNSRRTFLWRPLRYVICTGKNRVYTWNFHKRSQFGNLFLFRGFFSWKNVVYSASVTEKKEKNIISIVRCSQYDVKLLTVAVFFCQDGNTPLHIAASMGHEKLIEMLLNAGSVTTVRNNVSS